MSAGGNDPLAERLSLVSKLACDLAHDARNALSAISYNVEFLREQIPRDGSPGADVQAECLEEVGDAVKRLSTLLRATFRQLEPLEADPSPETVLQLFEETRLLVEGYARHSHHQLRIERAEVVPVSLEFDATLSLFTIARLVVEALDAAETPGTPVLRLSVDADARKLCATLSPPPLSDAERRHLAARLERLRPHLAELRARLNHGSLLGAAQEGHRLSLEIPGLGGHFDMSDHGD
ncbi:MAG: histidine kinase dimerization/phospho-acceptor domain-containing protein [Myxococcota bacterium]